MPTNTFLSSQELDAKRELVLILGDPTITRPNPTETFKWLDDLFFSSRLQNYRYLVQYQPAESLAGKLAECHFQPESNYDFKIAVAYTHPEFSGKQSIFESLLHEMVHAYIFVVEYQANLEDHNNHIDEIGTTGHGEPWMEKALIVEREAEFFFGGGWNLGRDRGYALQWVSDQTSERFEIPSADEAQRWGFEFSYILQLIMIFKFVLVAGEVDDAGDHFS